MSFLSERNMTILAGQSPALQKTAISQEATSQEAQ